VKVTVVCSLTLDGVMQAPGRPDEDTRGGFTHGGWGVPYADEVMGRRMQRDMSLMRRNLVDEYLLLIHPLVLGAAVSSPTGCSLSSRSLRL